MYIGTGLVPPPTTKGDNMYNDLYELLLNGIYGAETALTADQTLTLTLLATIGCVFMVSLPFLVVYKVVQLLCG